MKHKMQIGEITSFIKDNHHSLHNVRVFSENDEKIIIFNIQNNTDFIDILKDKEIAFEEYHFTEHYLNPFRLDDTIEGEAIDIKINYTKEQDNIFMKVLVMEILEYGFLSEMHNIVTITTELTDFKIVFNNHLNRYNHKLLEKFFLLLNIYGIKDRIDLDFKEEYQILIFKKDSSIPLEIFLEKIKQKILKNEHNNRTC